MRPTLPEKNLGFACQSAFALNGNGCPAPQNSMLRQPPAGAPGGMNNFSRSTLRRGCGGMVTPPKPHAHPTARRSQLSLAAKSKFFFTRVVHVVCARKLITPVRSMRIRSCACQEGSYAREAKRCVLRKLPPPMARLTPFQCGSDQGAWSGEGLGVARGRPGGVQ
jgi:hypothetical protein